MGYQYHHLQHDAIAPQWGDRAVCLRLQGTE